VSAPRAAAPGLALAAGLGGLGLGLGALLPGLGGVSASILLGLVVGNAARPGPRWTPGLGLAAGRGLELAVVLLGLRLDPRAVAALGAPALAAVGSVVALTLVGTAVLGRLLGLSRSLALMLAAGQAICGTAAVAAVAPVVDGRDGEPAIAVGVINALGTVGVFAVPALAFALGLPPAGAALVVGGGLQSVGHVVAAGFALGSEAGELATVLKLGRVALLPLVVLGVGLLAGGRRDEARARRRRLPRLPGYLVGFVVAVGLRALVPLPREVDVVLGPATQLLLATAMAAIGSRIQLGVLRTQGPRVLAAGALAFLIQLGVLVALARVLA
jgi:uncharacterized integral membrane protein (TIGR00698 family)